MKYPISNFKYQISNKILNCGKLKIRNRLAKRVLASQERFQRGSSLVELIIYMGTLSMMVGVLTMVFSLFVDLQTESQSYSNVEQDARYIISRLTYDIHRATTVTSPALGVQNNTLQLTVGGQSFQYSLDGTNLTLNDGSVTNIMNSMNTSISNLTFQRLGNSGVGSKHTVRVSFRVTSRILRGTGYESRNVTTTIGLR